MKHFIILIGLFFVFACSSDNDNLEASDSNPTLLTIVDNWYLVEMRGSAPNTTTTGQDMEWQETYTFNQDSTFTKTRYLKTSKSTLEGSGTYLYVENNNEAYLQLNYNDNNKIIGSCTSDNSETLFFNESSQLISGWNACDGPGLVYEKATYLD
ncbi:hypothetical protein [Joostella sp.]|uniref:hypothetical protein n=1 Tax=Joostella sp. TaxID=2231138 RepID=UPI003A8D9D26